MKCEEWYTWRELEEFFGKLNYLSTLSIAYNRTWKLTVFHDGRRNKNFQLWSVKNKKTGELWHPTLKKTVRRVTKGVK